MELLQALNDSWLAALLRRPGPVYPLVNAAHILSLGMLVGTVAVLGLRLLGLFGRAPVSIVAPLLSRVSATALFSAALTGVMLFSVRPLVYAENPALLAKLALVALGIGNALVVRQSAAWARAIAGGSVAPQLRAQALLSLCIWVAAVLAGRWIAFLR